MGNLVLNKTCGAVQSGGTVYPLTAELALNASRNSAQRCAWLLYTKDVIKKYLSVDMGDYYMLTGYRVTCITETDGVSDTWPSPDYLMKGWMFYASKDGESWVQLHKVTNNNSGVVFVTFTPDPNEAYRYVKFVPDRFYINNNASILQLEVFEQPFLISMNCLNTTLSPEFSMQTYAYTAQLTLQDSAIALVPTTINNEYAIMFDGDTIQNGSTLSAMVDYGTTQVTLNVKSPADGAVRPYVITVTRPGPYLTALSLNSGTLSPTFDCNTFSYNVSLGYDTESVTVTAAEAMPEASLTINGQAAQNNAPSQPVALSVGANTVKAVSALQSGQNTEYDITVTRASSPYLTGIQGLNISNFQKNVYQYSAEININSLDITFFTEDEQVRLEFQYGDTEYNVYPQKQLILILSYGSNTLTITTTSQIGSDSRTYTFLVTVN